MRGSEDIYGPGSESKNENPFDSEKIIIAKGCKPRQMINKNRRYKKTFKNGDFILIKLRVWKKMDTSSFL